MKLKKHGCGLSHKEVVQFSNRLAAMQDYDEVRSSYDSDYESGWYSGWSACAQFFAHELRVYLRAIELKNPI